LKIDTHTPRREIWTHQNTSIILNDVFPKMGNADAGCADTYATCSTSALISGAFPCI
jgi:hypothetical protein